MDATVVGPPESNVTEVEVDGRACLLSPLNHDVVVLNQSASDVWYLCDGTESVLQITERLARAYGVTANEISADVEAAVRSFRAAGLIPVSDNSYA